MDEFLKKENQKNHQTYMQTKLSYVNRKTKFREKRKGR